MESQETPLAPTPEQIAQNLAWWNTLSEPWKRAFNEVIRQNSTADVPDDETLHSICTAEVHRFSGPGAPFPNMSFELEDMSGITGLNNLKILILGFQKLTSLREIGHLKELRSLFVFNNQIDSLEGIESLENLTDLYFNVNQVSSLVPLQHLTNLQTIYCNYNNITSLEGIGEQHVQNLKNFVCLPNEQLAFKEIGRMERDIGIQCVKA